MNKHTPFWFPVICDKAYFSRLREDYPETAHMTDEGLHDLYNDGQKYSTTWDNIGDAYSDYEPLTDSFLEVLEALESLLRADERVQTGHNIELAVDAMQAAREAIAKVKGKP